MARAPVPITVVDLAGNAVQGAAVTIRKRSDNSLATLYVAETGGTTTGNPVATNTQGRTGVWVDRGAYAATITGTGITTYVENFEAAPAKDAGIDLLWGSAIAGGYTTGLLAARPATPTTPRDLYYATDDWGGTLYAAKSDLTGWTAISSKNQYILDVSAVTSATFSNLDGDTDQYYRLDFAADFTGSINPGIRFNGDTGANYNIDYFYSATGGALNIGQSAAQTAGYLAIGSAGTQRVTGSGVVTAKTNGVMPKMFQSTYGVAGGGNLHGSQVSWWNTSNTNLTSITILASAGTFTGRFILHRGLMP